ncbi:unnamed protein product [Thelazia callipaeda]|uniref:Uncharacterized protein n=1 Tax=Thelazia callipaeda TaxID=103827 RepID=A0A0N5CN15_THECL|nr:unnamed protein product [Thelazia callipaeda]
MFGCYLQHNQYELSENDRDVIYQRRLPQKTKPIDFAKVLETFLAGSKGNFDDSIYNLPELLGLCNRLSCGDIYKAIDEFRKSEFFTNFQIALQLIQDPKGWEILGDLISNPDFIQKFIGGGEEKGVGSGLEKITPEDGDIGIDFSELVKSNSSQFIKVKKPTIEELPEIAENIDATDYYNALENGADLDNFEEITKPDELPVTAAPTITKVPELSIIPKIIMPGIAENIDETEQTKITIDMTTPEAINFSERRIAANTSKPEILRSTTTFQVSTKRGTSITKNLVTTTHRPSKTISTTKIAHLTSIPRVRTTTKNFREESDYYAMYYDDFKS